MRTGLIVLILALTASSVMSACGSDNFIATHFGITGLKTATNEATLLAAVPQCNLAIGDKVCIDEAGLTTTLQGKIDALRTTLQTAAGVRDKYIIAQRGEVIKVLGSLRRLNELSTAANLAKVPETYRAIAEDFFGWATAIAANFSAIVENFDAYQTARQTCMNSLLKVQGTILCASIQFDPQTLVTLNAAEASNTVGIDNSILNTLSTDCFNYIDYSERQSAIMAASVFSAGLANLVSGIEKIVNNDATGAATDVTAAFTEFNKTTYSTTAGQEPVELPKTANQNCVRDTKNCNDYIEKVLFSPAGILSNADAILGGEKLTKPAFKVSRVLESEGNERRLVASGYAPNLDNYHFTIAFEKNPGGVDNTSNAKSALRNGIVACAVAALALVF